MKNILIAFLALFSQYAYSQVGVATADTSLRATVNGAVFKWKSSNYYASLFAAFRAQSNALYAPITGGGYVPNSRTLTFNGVTQDLSSNRTFNITDITGNSGTATILQTARTINGVAFNGSANITVSDATKEPLITAGTTLQYWRGDKTFQTLNTSVVPESGNLYWTQARFDTGFSGKSTSNLAEGTNLYYTNTRVNTVAPTLTGSGASGTWPISITGNSANATTWNGAVFDGQSVLTGTYTYILGYNGTKWMPSSAAQVQTFLGLGPNAYTSTAYTPTARTITINGVTQDLSSNRTFTVTSATPTLDQVLTAGASSNQTAGFGNVNVIGNVTAAGYNATSGTVSNAPVASTDVVNKTYADALGKEYLTVNSWGSNPTLYITGGSFYAGGSVSVVYIDCSTGNKTLYLPTITDMFGRKVVVYKTDASANTATITSTAALNINGSPTYTLTTQYQSVEIRAGNNGFTIPNQYYAR